MADDKVLFNDMHETTQGLIGSKEKGKRRHPTVFRVLSDSLIGSKEKGKQTDYIKK